MALNSNCYGSVVYKDVIDYKKVYSSSKMIVKIDEKIFKYFFTKLINLNFEIKYLILFLQDLSIYLTSSIFSILFFTFQKGFLIQSLIIYLITSLIFLIISSLYFNVYKSFLRYGEFRNLLKTFSYVFISFCLTSFSIYFLLNEIYLTFQKITFLSHLLIFTFIISSRIFIFFIIKKYQKRKIVKKVVVYGAGYAGAQIAQNQNYEIVAFIDEDIDKVGRTLNDIKIYDSKSIKYLIKKNNPDFLLIAIPSLTQKQRKKFINKFIEFNIPIKFYQVFLIYLLVRIN